MYNTSTEITFTQKGTQYTRFVHVQYLFIEQHLYFMVETVFLSVIIQKSVCTYKYCTSAEHFLDTLKALQQMQSIKIDKI